MSFHAGAKRPARGNVLDRVRSPQMAAEEPPQLQGTWSLEAPCW